MREEFVQHSGVSIITSLSTEATTGTSWSVATPKERYTMAAQTQDHDIQRLMNNIRVVQGSRSCDEMAGIMHCSPNTYRRRRDHPEELTYYDMKVICEDRGISIISFLSKDLFYI